MSTKEKNIQGEQPETIGRRFAASRKQAGLTQEQLAFDLQDRGVCVGSSDISKIENDVKFPKSELLCEVHRLLGVSIDYILLGNEAVAPPPHMSANMERAILSLADEIRAFHNGKSTVYQRTDMTDNLR